MVLRTMVLRIMAMRITGIADNGNAEIRQCGYKRHGHLAAVCRTSDGHLAAACRTSDGHLAAACETSNGHLAAACRHLPDRLSSKLKGRYSRPWGFVLSLLLLWLAVLCRLLLALELETNLFEPRIYRRHKEACSIQTGCERNQCAERRCKHSQR